MMRRGQVMSHHEMCQAEGTSLQRGMNFRLNAGHSVFLMSLRPGAPYDDEIAEGGRVLFYEGHDAPRSGDGSDPKSIDQPMTTPRGRLTQNGLFFEAARRYKNRGGQAEHVRVYEKIRDGLWVYNGSFHLVDAWQQERGGRMVFRFKLKLTQDDAVDDEPEDLEHDRIIPTSVKLEVWKRDRGRCVRCGSSDNLHFDHVIPFSKGGSSLTAENIQLLCARHNLSKHDRIE